MYGVSSPEEIPGIERIARAEKSPLEPSVPQDRNRHRSTAVPAEKMQLSVEGIRPLPYYCPENRCFCYRNRLIWVAISGRRICPRSELIHRPPDGQGLP